MNAWYDAVGLLAAAITSLSQIPQLLKALPRGSTDDISLKAYSALFVGLALWLIYGISKGDWIVAVANAVGATLVCAVLICKLRDIRGLPRKIN